MCAVHAYKGCISHPYDYQKKTEFAFLLSDSVDMANHVFFYNFFFALENCKDELYKSTRFWAYAAGKK